MFGILAYNENVNYPNKFLNYNGITKLVTSSFSQDKQSTFSGSEKPFCLFFLLLTCYRQWTVEAAVSLSCPCALQCYPADLAFLSPSLHLVDTSACGEKRGVPGSHLDIQWTGKCSLGLMLCSAPDNKWIVTLIVCIIIFFFIWSSYGLEEKHRTCF